MQDVEGHEAGADAAPHRSGWTVGRVIVAIVGSILGLAGLAALAGGGVAAWAAATQRDADGYFTTGTERFSSSGYAVVSDDIDLGSDERPQASGFEPGDLVRIRVRAEAADGSTPVFVGIARADDVAEYLRDVPHDVVDDVDLDPFRVDYRSVAGSGQPEPPSAQGFWAASTADTGTRTVTWEPERGDWTIVVMNESADRGVAADIAVGVEVRHLWLIVLAILAVGAVLLTAGVLLILFAGRRASQARVRPDLAAASVAAAAGVAPGASDHPRTRYPLSLTGRLDEPLSRWLWLVKWLLAIPHFFVLIFLWIAAIVLTVVAGVAILFTGVYPRGIFDFNVGVLRWTWRVVHYATGVLGTDRYPPFTLGAVAGETASLDVVYPDHLSRGLVLVKWWLLVLPHYIVVGIIGSGWSWGPVRPDDAGGWFAGWAGWGGGLLGILVLIAAVRLLFTGRYPREMFDLVVGLNRWVLRVAAYAMLLTDVYPPFRLDQGGEEPVER
jgi:hypothetical protein